MISDALQMARLAPRRIKVFAGAAHLARSQSRECTVKTTGEPTKDGRQAKLPGPTA